MMGEMVPLHFSHVLRQLSMVERVVHAVVKNVECEGAGNNTIGDIGREDDVRKLGEWRFEKEEQGRRHDETQSVHGEVMVDTVEKEMEHQRPVGVREQVVNVEEESVEGVLEDRPEYVSGEKACQCRSNGGQGRDGESGKAGSHCEQVGGGDFTDY
jgi:hypothetical protein